MSSVVTTSGSEFLQARYRPKRVHSRSCQLLTSCPAAPVRTLHAIPMQVESGTIMASVTLRVGPLSTANGMTAGVAGGAAPRLWFCCSARSFCSICMANVMSSSTLVGFDDVGRLLIYPFKPSMRSAMIPASPALGCRRRARRCRRSRNSSRSLARLGFGHILA